MLPRLIKFQQKVHARLFLRKNKLDATTRSSLYLVDEYFYLMFVNNDDMKFPSDQTNGVEIITRLNDIEKEILAWAYSEITQDIKFIHYETKSTLKLNQHGVTLGRCRTVKDVEIIRLFAPLFDVMAIINYTEDSFSDGGKYNTLDTMLEKIKHEVNALATIIDIGVESTRPNAKPLDYTTEIMRLKEIMPEVGKLKQEYGFFLSIDTYHPETVEWLLKNRVDFDIINDVSGNLSNELVLALIQTQKKYVAMHSLSVPSDKNVIMPLESNPITILNAFFKSKVSMYLNSGISLDQVESQIIFDPGIGFGNNQAQAWYILRNLHQLDTHGAQLLLGHSRKSFLKHLTSKNLPDFDVETAIIAAQLAKVVDMVRVHDTITLGKMYALAHHCEQS